MSAVPLDVAPERRTERCCPRFRPGDRFWNQDSDTCRQAVRERSVGPQTIRDRSLSSTRFVTSYQSLSYKYQSLPVTAYKWQVKVCLSGSYLTSAQLPLKTVSLQLSLRAGAWTQNTVFSLTYLLKTKSATILFLSFVSKLLP